MTTNQTADPLAIAVDVVSALYVITVRDAAIIISRVRQQPPVSTKKVEPNSAPST